MYKEWFEPALAGHLDRVAAPEDLWDRIQNPQPRKARVPASARIVRMCACAAMVLLAAWLYPRSREVRSGDAAGVRSWVRANTGIDVPLLRQPAGIRVTGARLAKGAVDIAFRVGPSDGHLAVIQGESGGVHANPHGRVFVWRMDGHTYTLTCATPEDLRMACGLCHVG
jgi:hypothetical protein